MNNLTINNPGNIRPGGNWNGEIGARAGFVQFDTMENGVAAVGKQLRAYVEGRRKIDSKIATLMPVWAPTSENDTAAYVAWVSKITELDPDDVLDLKDFSTCYWYTRAIGEWEQGRQTFDKGVPEAELQAGVNLAIAWAGPR